MKKLILICAALVAVTFVNAQSLETIIKQYATAMNSDKLSSIKTIKITGKMSAMGMEMPMVMQMKNPDKVRVTYSFNGMEMISVFDGVKGYAMNPMTGSTEPVELTGSQLTQVKNNNIFTNQLQEYYKNKQLTLEGVEDVDGKPANKLKVNVEGGNPIYMFVDKGTGLIVKSTTKAEQMGTTMDVETYMTDYTDTKGVILPKKTIAKMNGMEAGVISFDVIEIDVPMDDALFKIK